SRSLTSHATNAIVSWAAPPSRAMTCQLPLLRCSDVLTKPGRSADRVNGQSAGRNRQLHPRTPWLPATGSGLPLVKASIVHNQAFDCGLEAIYVDQVPHLLGISGASGNFFAKIWNVWQHLSDVSVGPVLTGMLCLTAMLLLRYMAPAVPAALVVMAMATIVIGLLGAEATGVHVVGLIPYRVGSPNGTEPRPHNIVRVGAGCARHCAGRVRGGARRSKSGGHAKRRRHQSEPGISRTRTSKHLERPFRGISCCRQPIEDFCGHGRRRPQS